MQNRVVLCSLLSLLTACSGGDTVAYLIPFTLVNNNLGVQRGTAHDDVWMIGGDGKDAQEDPFDTRVQYWNGTTAASVPLSLDVFREGACGMPSTSAAVTRGEIWLGSFHVPNCGISPPTSYDTLIFGKLKSDGTWEDHSADFPAGPIGTYKKIDLQGRDGVLYVGVEYGVPSTSYKLFRYAADGTHTELPLPDGFTGKVEVLGVDELFSVGSSGDQLYRNGAWTTMGMLSFNPGSHHVNTGGERWSFGPLLDQADHISVIRYADGTFTEVSMPFPAGQHADANNVPLNLVPRGGGKLTWFTVQRSVHPGGLTIVARDFDGSTLGGMRTIQTQGSCSGTPDYCLARDAGVFTLADGSVLVGGANVFLFAVPVDAL